ncbi:MAG TPA: hypothetical protein VLC06_11310 [Polyangia bacterium]|jgi:hypothetical protein|nr:hypothetical protein [Polyangia bacterium]
MGWVRLGVALMIACGGCEGANGGSEGTVVLSHGEGGSATDGATRDANRVPLDAAATEAGPDEAGIDAGPAVTWTGIYQNLLVNQGNPSNCTGASCHDPGTEKGIDLSTPQMGYTTISHRLVPGSPDSSELITVLESGYMPEGRPRMTAAGVSLIRAWIQAGALDN